MCIWKDQGGTQLLLKSGGTTEEVADGQVAHKIFEKFRKEQLAEAFSGSRTVNPLATVPPTW